MHYIPFNSRKSYHKTPFGAVGSGDDVTLRVILPREFQCRAVWLVVHRDDRRDWSYFPFSWECMEGYGEEWWRITYTPDSPGLYWYHFEYDTDWGRVRINCAGGGIGRINGENADWQLTVYDKKTKSPVWLKGGVIYQIFPDRFFSSGEPKKNVPSDRIIRSDWGGEPMWEPDGRGRISKYDYFGGDLKGIEQKLPYLQSLGITCIYLNPIFEAHSNHRYDVADYMKIDPLLGTEEDFKDLCAAARDRGIRIVLDGVFSHTGADSVYFNKRGRYGSGGAYNSKKSEYYSWYKFRRWPDDYVSWWDIDILPEVNEEDESYLDFIAGRGGVLEKWMDAGASGFRIDVADELPDKLLDRVYETVKRKNLDAYIVGEVWEDASNKYSYGKRRRYLLGGQMDSVMNYPFADAVLSFVKTGCAEVFMDKIITVLENYPREVVDTLMNHIGTHDTVRAVTLLAKSEKAERSPQKRSPERLTIEQLEKGIALLKAASTLQFTLPGVPSVYYGDEAGLDGGADPYNRRCYPWDHEDGGLLRHYTELSRIRREHPCFIDGEFVPISAALGCVAYARIKDGGGVIVIANMNCHEIEYYLPPEWHGARLLLGGTGCDGSTVKLGAAAAAVLDVRC